MNTPVVIIVNNIEAMRIDSNGNVGIGTCSPTPTWPFNIADEPLTKWYKAGVEQTGLVPHKKEQDGNSKT